MVTSTITTPGMNYRRFESVFETSRYPAGERHVRLNESVDPTTLRTVEADARSFDDLGQIVTADRILRRLGTTVEWFIPYFPFARHDRRNDAIDGMELEVAMEMVSELRIVIADPHSEVTAGLPHFPQSDAVACFERAGLFDDNPVVVIPDAGAAKKAHGWLAGREFVQALKHRDPRTGNLSGFAVLTDDLDGRPCIIVDDICDGGGTFIGLAAELKAKGAGQLRLAVTHGLFTRGAAGVSSLAELFSTIACLTPLDADPIAGVTAIPFNDLYNKGSII